MNQKEVIHVQLELSTETRVLILEVGQSPIRCSASLFIRSRSFQCARQSGRIPRPSAYD
jgi:hypothetical protein